MTREDYYKNPRISNSSLDWILPETGGSPKKFEERHLFPMEELDSAEARLGTLAHQMVENKGDMSKFKVIQMPSPGVLRICDEAMAHPLFDLLNPGELKKIIVKVARDQEFQPRWGDDAIFTNVCTNGIPYMTNVTDAKADGVSLVSEEEMSALNGMRSSLEDSCSWLFDEKNFPLAKPGSKIEILREVPIEWEYEVLASGATHILECKSLIDILVINHTEKWKKVIDFKTTKSALSHYTGYMSRVIKDTSIVDEFIPGIGFRRMVPRQLSFYCEAVIAGFPALSEYEMRSPGIIACETIAPFESMLFRFPIIQMEYGHHMMNKAMQLIAVNGIAPTSGL